MTIVRFLLTKMSNRYLFENLTLRHVTNETKKMIMSGRVFLSNSTKKFNLIKKLQKRQSKNECVKNINSDDQNTGHSVTTNIRLPDLILFDKQITLFR